MKLRLFALVAIALPGSVALAQSDPMQMARVTTANQIGVMEYCQSKGWVDQAAVDAQKSGASSLPPTTDASGVASAEAIGKKGTLLNNGTPTPLSSMASQTNTSEQALCGKLADSAKMVAAQRRSMPSMPNGMLGMPGGMPALPSGMSMPGMPKTQ